MHLSLLLITIVKYTAARCVVRCKDNHLQEMRKVMGDVSEWSAEFVAPLQAILKQSSNYYVVDRRLREMCRANRLYHDCLTNECTQYYDNVQQRILLAGQEPSEFICRKLLSEDAMHDLLPCWQQYKEEMLAKCHPAELQLRHSLNAMANASSMNRRAMLQFDLLCRASKDYESCWLTQTQLRCDTNDANFLRELSRVTAASMSKMVAIATKARTRQRAAKCTYYTLIRAFPVDTQDDNKAVLVPPSCQSWTIGNYTHGDSQRLHQLRNAFRTLSNCIHINTLSTTTVILSLVTASLSRL